jgi:hypothetical protein
MTFRVCDYFLPDDAELRKVRLLYLPGGMLEMGLEYFRGEASQPNLYTLRQTNPDGTWNSDWLLRVEADGSVTEYGDLYPKKSGVSDYADFWRSHRQVFFRSGFEIKWQETGRGQIKPNYRLSSPSKWGSGTYVSQLGKYTEQSADLYMEQHFGKIERAVYHLRKGFGIYSVSYYAENGDSNTISIKE